MAAGFHVGEIRDLAIHMNSPFHRIRDHGSRLQVSKKSSNGPDGPQGLSIPFVQGSACS